MEDGSSYMGIDDDYPGGMYFLNRYRIMYVYVAEYIKNFPIHSQFTACLCCLKYIS